MAKFSHDTRTVAKAVGIAARRTVVECPSPADAASPVFLHQGERVQSIGQSADYRHHVKVAAEKRGAVLVEGYYRNDKYGRGGEWETFATGLDAEQERRVRDLLSKWDYEAASKEAAAREAADEAERRERLPRMRREIGLPDGVLPHIRLVRVNGSVGILPPDGGPPYFGAFSVDAAGNLVIPNKK